MLENFWFNVEYGINHVLDINAYDHVLFLISLTVPYVFKDWKRVLILVSMFTLGHTLSLVLAAYGIVSVNAGLVEFLIPITILIVALYNVFTAGKKPRKIGTTLLLITVTYVSLDPLATHQKAQGGYIRTLVPARNHYWLRSLLDPIPLYLLPPLLNLTVAPLK